MKITIQIDENCIEDEVIIRCKEFSDLTGKIQKAVSEATSKETKMELFQDNKSFYIPVTRFCSLSQIRMELARIP